MGLIDNYKQRSAGGKVMFLTGLMFLGLYVALGIVFVFVKNLPFNMSHQMKVGFGVLLIAYAAFRFWRMCKE